MCYSSDGNTKFQQGCWPSDNVQTVAIPFAWIVVLPRCKSFSFKVRQKITAKAVEPGWAKSQISSAITDNIKTKLNVESIVLLVII